VVVPNKKRRERTSKTSSKPKAQRETYWAVQVPENFMTDDELIAVANGIPWEGKSLAFLRAFAEAVQQASVNDLHTPCDASRKKPPESAK
jgi:hypothetical protein